MRILLTDVFLLHFGYYMVLPILPILLKDKGLTVVQVGITMAAISFSFQAGSVIGGYLADRLGRRFIIVLGAWLRAAALAGFGFFAPFWLLLVAAILDGIGGGLNAPATKAAFAAVVSDDEYKTTAFSLRGIAANLGVATAGLIVYFLLRGSSTLIFYSASIIFVLLGFVSWIFLEKNNCGEKPCPIVPSGAFLQVFKNKTYVVFSILSVLIWALYTQFTLATPLRATTILANPTQITLIWTINSIIVVFLQAPVMTYVLNKIHPMTALSIASLFIGAGIVSLYWCSSFPQLIISGVIFIFGEMMLMPTMDSTVSDLANPQIVGMYFGIANFISGLGEGIGNYGGGRLLGYGITSYVPWTIYAVLALLTSALILMFRAWVIRHPSNTAGFVGPNIEKYSSHEWQGAMVFGKKEKAK